MRLDKKINCIFWICIVLSLIIPTTEMILGKYEIFEPETLIIIMGIWVIIVLMAIIACNIFLVMHKKQIKYYKKLFSYDTKVEILVDRTEMEKNFKLLSDMEKEILSNAKKPGIHFYLKRIRCNPIQDQLQVICGKECYCIYTTYQYEKDNEWIDFIKKSKYYKLKK